MMFDDQSCSEEIKMYSIRHSFLYNVLMLVKYEKYNKYENMKYYSTQSLCTQLFGHVCDQS